jgi:hypothetical protein
MGGIGKSSFGRPVGSVSGAEFPPALLAQFAQGAARRCLLGLDNSKTLFEAGLALKIVGETIRQVFDRHIGAFLEEAIGTYGTVFGGVPSPAGCPGGASVPNRTRRAQTTGRGA